MGKTLNSAAASDHLPDRLTKLGEMVDAKYSDRTLRNPPSLQALKLQDVLMKNAGGRLCDDVWHEFDLASFKRLDGMRNLTHEDTVRLFEELRGATMRHVNHKEGHTAIYGLIAVGRVDFEDVGKVRYKFDDEFRKVAEMSDLYAVLDYRTTLALGSRYAHRLHEMIAFRAGREKRLELFTLDDLRARLGVATGKLGTWTALKQRALDPAIDEVNQSSRFRVSYRVTKKDRRKTVEIELAWAVREDLEAAKKEQSAHSVARKGRLNEELGRHVFPVTGGTAYTTPWDTIRKANCNWDQAKAADGFRSFCTTKNIRLDAQNIEKIFTAFCKTLPKL